MLNFFYLMLIYLFKKNKINSAFYLPLQFGSAAQCNAVDRINAPDSTKQKQCNNLERLDNFSSLLNLLKIVSKFFKITQIYLPLTPHFLEFNTF